MGPHKAFQIARDATRLKLLLVSDMEPGFVHQLLLMPADSLQTAIDETVSGLPQSARIGVMPKANTTIPLLLDPPDASDCK